MNSIDMPKYTVGIDLGTTHCVLSYAVHTNLENDEFSQQVMPIPQLTAPGTVEDKLQLPSFIYQAHAAELAEGEVALPWTNNFVCRTRTRRWDWYCADRQTLPKSASHSPPPPNASASRPIKPRCPMRPNSDDDWNNSRNFRRTINDRTHFATPRLHP